MTYGQIAVWLVSLKFSGFHGVIVGGGLHGICNLKNRSVVGFTEVQ